jgi:ribosomal protein S12 methylthiotransferase
MAKKAETRKIHFVSLGCAKNKVDSEVMLGVAAGAGLSITAEAEDADVIVVNTCGFIGEAKRESIDTIFELAAMKEHGKCEKLVVSGCLSQRYSGQLADQMPEVDHFLGSSDMLKLADVLKGDADRMLVGSPADWVVRASDPRMVTRTRASAYVKIAEGCNRSCAFCVIPEIRGKQRSRTLEDVVREVEQLVDQGVREINVVSQDTIAWGRDLKKEDPRRLADLLRAVGDVKGLDWLRVFYLYPETMDDALVDLYANHGKVLPYVDMPLQHASDAMLKRMKRGHGKGRQERVVERLKNAIPGLTMRTGFIVGHPGESDADFQELVDFVEWAEFDYVGVFRYSDEETCASHEQDAHVGAKTSYARQRKLKSVARTIARKKNKARIGQRLRVLVEGVSEEHELVLEGRHAGQAPEIDGKVFLSGGEAAAGQFVDVEITQAADMDLVGEIVGVEDAPKKRKSPKKLPLLGAH